MLVKEAKAAAQQWVETQASEMPDFAGAYICGSVNWMNDDDVMPSTSDFDIRVVLNSDTVPHTFNKFLFDDVLLEVSYVSFGEVNTPEAVLSNYHTAGHFTRACILGDPENHLAEIQKVVKKAFARRKWVQARVDHAKSWQVDSLGLFLNTSDPLHDQVFAWVYANSIFAQTVLVADLKNPTVRKMMAAAQDVLKQYDQLAFHERVLEILGCATFSRDHVEQQFEDFTEVFDATQIVRESDSGISDSIIDGGRAFILGSIQELIQRGYHREAVFWLLVSHTRCQKIIYENASPDIQAEFTGRYEDFLRSLGVTSLDDVYRRIEEVKALRPQADEVVNDILARNPNIVG